MKLHIRILTLIALSSLNSLTMYSQTVNQINAELRALFSNLQTPTPSRLFLFDMAAHFTDSTLFVKHNTNDTISSDVWFKLHEEMRNSAYDTTTMITAETLYDNCMLNFNDTNSITIMGYDYYTFIDTALTTNTYFDFDTVNTILTDKFPRPGYPFNIGTIFSASPVKHQMNYRKSIFKIDPQHIFYDQFSLMDPSIEHEIVIDFGDGMGWHTVNENAVNYFPVTYPSAGSYVIKTGVKDGGGNLQYISLSRITILTDIVEIISPDDRIILPGITANVYNPCDPTAQVYEKVIIYVEGIDIMDVVPGQNRTADDIYTFMVAGNELHRLQDFGYTIIVVDWHNSRKDMRINALNLMGLIEYLKCKQASGDVDAGEQFVILGESMGGLIARYCLTYMETHPTHCLPKEMHNTRLLITLDSPHKGANVPLSLQHMYRFLGGGIMGEFNTITQKIVGKSWNLFLDATAAQQMLLYHVDTYIPTAPYSPYAPHPAKAWFDADLLLIGNYPKFSKMVAMSNGSLAGLSQTSIWNTGVQRTPNDRLLYINSDMNLRVLGRTFKIAGTLLDLKTNPNGNGNIATIEHGTWFVKIKLKWFGIKFQHGFNSLVGKYYNGNTLPLCVRPGGVWDGDNMSGFNVNNVTNALQSLNNTFGIGNAAFVPTGGGNFTVTNNSGGWFFGGSNTTTVGSDGFHWNFIPVTSALDYASTSLAPDIQNENILIKTNANPFGVITGITDTYADEIWGPTNIFLNNRNHLFMRNDILNDVNNDPLVYDSCAHVPIRMLNREIGDDELWLENRVLPWQGAFSIQNRIMVNHRTAFYEYPLFNTPQNIEGVYSKQHPFIILPGIGHATFNVNGFNLNYIAPFSGSYSVNDAQFVPCCDGVAPPSNKEDNTVALSPLSESTDITLFPNPVTANQFTFRMKGYKDYKASYEIFNVLGQTVQTTFFPIQQNGELVNIPVSIEANLPNGIYTIRVKNLDYIYKQTLIIQK